MQYKRIVKVKMPTNRGLFHLIGYQNGDPNKHHVALIKGNPKNQEGVLVRIHSSCVTGDIFGSLRCDCGAQLEKAMEIIESAGCGIILYLFQEGRGIGLINKLKAYKLQESGLDTVEANIKLGLPADQRDYLPGAEILKDIGVKSIKLMTNNPEKINNIQKYGIKVIERVSLEIKPVKQNKTYLSTKKERMGHKLSLV